MNYTTLKITKTMGLIFTLFIGGQVLADQDFPMMNCPASLTVQVSEIKDSSIPQAYGKASDYADLANALSQPVKLNLVSNQVNSTFLEQGFCGYDNHSENPKTIVAASLNRLGVVTIFLPVEKPQNPGEFDPMPSVHFARIYSTPFDRRARVGSSGGCYIDDKNEFNCANVFSTNSDGQDWLNISKYKIVAEYGSGQAAIVLQSK